MEIQMDYKKFIDRDNGNILPLFADKEVFKSVVQELTSNYSERIDFVLGIEARGFIIGGAIASLLNTGFIAVRKSGRIRADVVKSKAFVDYSGQEKVLEIQKDTLLAGQNVLIIDDWVETGNQVKAVIEMVEGIKANIVGIATIVDEAKPETREYLDGYSYKYLVRYDD